jgi:hypothetical protein
MTKARITEMGVTFYKAGGHKHDGIGSSLIDTSKYSIFDFDLSLSSSNSDANRDTVRRSNRTRFDQYISRFVTTQVLAPAGIILPVDSVRGVNIGANEITANEIAANTITANELITDFAIVNSTIRSNNFTYNANTGVGTGWAIYGNGTAVFVDGIFSGEIDVGGFDNSSFHVDTGGNVWSGSGSFSTAPFRVYANGRVIAGNGGVDISTSGELSVTGSTTVGGNLSVVGSSISLGSVGSSTSVSGTLNVSSSTSISGGLNVSGTVSVSSNITRSGVWRLTNTGFFAGPDDIVSVTANGLSFPAGGIFDASGGGVGIRVGSTFRFIVTSTDTITPVAVIGSGNQMHYNNTFGFLMKSSSMRNLKDNIDYNIDGISIIKKLKPALFTWKPQEGDSEEVAALRPLYKNYGFIAEDIAEVDRSLATWDAGTDWDAPKEENEAKIRNLDGWFPSYYDHAGLLSVSISSIKQIIDLMDDFNGRLTSLEGRM